MTKSFKKKLNNLQHKLRNKKQKGSGKLTLRCSNMDCGPPFHPQWQKMVGGKKVNSKKFKQLGGDGQGNQGHDVSMPIQYYGQKLNRYFPAGSSELNLPNSAYGKTIATSHGVTINGNSKFVGLDLGPFNGSIGISGIQTGGGKKKKSARTKMIKNKKLKSVKRGGMMSQEGFSLGDGSPRGVMGDEEPQLPESFRKIDSSKLLCQGFAVLVTEEEEDRESMPPFELSLYMNGVIRCYIKNPSEDEDENDITFYFLITRSPKIENRVLEIYGMRYVEDDVFDDQTFKFKYPPTGYENFILNYETQRIFDTFSDEQNFLRSLSLTPGSSIKDYFTSLFEMYPNQLLQVKTEIGNLIRKTLESFEPAAAAPSVDAAATEISPLPKSFTIRDGVDGFKLICSGFINSRSEKIKTKITLNVIKLYANGLITVEHDQDIYFYLLKNLIISKRPHIIIQGFDINSGKFSTLIFEKSNILDEYDLLSNITTPINQQGFTKEEKLFLQDLECTTESTPEEYFSKLIKYKDREQISDSEFIEQLNVYIKDDSNSEKFKAIGFERSLLNAP